MFFSFLPGEGGRGRSEAPGGGVVRFFIENPRRGVFQEGGAKGPGGCRRRIGEFGGGEG